MKAHIKKVKRIAFIVLATVLITSVATKEIKAYDGGFLDGKATDDGSYDLTDGNTDTTYRVTNTGVTFTLNEPVTIDRFYYDTGNPFGGTAPDDTNNLIVEFYDASDDLILTHDIDDISNGITDLGADITVSKVLLINEASDSSTNRNVAEFDILSSPDLTPPGEVTNIASTPGINKVNFTFDLPSDSDFSHVQAYLDGILVGDNIATGSYSFTGLDPNTPYEFKFKTLDIHGNESSGVTNTERTSIDYSGGLLDGEALNYGTDENSINGTKLSATDNDETTSARVGYRSSASDTYWYEFETPVNINSIRFKRGIYIETHVVYSNGDDEVVNLSSRDGSSVDVSLSNVKKIYFENTEGNNRQVYEFNVYGSEIAPPPGEVTNLKESLSPTKIQLDYEHPNDSSFKGVNVYLDGSLVKKETTKTSVEIQDLTPETIYQVKVTTVGESGSESEGITTAYTLPPLEEIKELKADAKSDRVDLSWNSPDYEGFHHVNIYRKVMQEEQSTAMSFLVPTVQAAETSEYDPIFETNGTYFNDLTVESETSYEYKLTTEEENGTESDGVTIQATTEPIPPPTVEESDVTKDENGDYLATWTGSGEGEMLVQVDGKDYKTVPYSDGQLLITAEDMKYDSLGAPIVSLVPLAPNGKSGSEELASGVKKGDMPFNAKDLLETTLNFLMFLAPIILLTLAIYYYRPLLNIIRRSVRRLRT